MIPGTIFALSSGAPPAAIAIVRVSGPSARSTAEQLVSRLPEPRVAALRSLRSDGDLIDRGLVLWFPADMSVTGEDLVEFHLHGSRAVVAATLEVLGREPSLRPAEPGEFSRRGLLNGRMDLAQAEALGDLLAAETEAERRAAIGVFAGALGAEVEGWRRALLDLAAQAEALLDYSDEGDVADSASERGLRHGLAELEEQLGRRAGGPAREELRDGITVVLAGPPNSGKSSLMNALARRDVALVTPVAGTTRDVVEVAMSIAGRRIRLLDTAGLHETGDVVERLGVARAREVIAAADLVVWLGDDMPSFDQAAPVLAILARCDLPGRAARPERLAVSSTTGAGLAELVSAIEAAVSPMMQQNGLELTVRQQVVLREIARDIHDAECSSDLLVVAEHLRRALAHVDSMTGRVTTDAVLDRVFARFCIGK